MSPTPTATAPADPRLAQVQSEVAALLAQGAGERRGQPHIPFVGVDATGPAVLWRCICTGAGCGSYVDDTTTEPPVDFLCDDCLEAA